MLTLHFDLGSHKCQTENLLAVPSVTAVSVISLHVCLPFITACVRHPKTDFCLDKPAHTVGILLSCPWLQEKSGWSRALGVDACAAALGLAVI